MRLQIVVVVASLALSACGSQQATNEQLRELPGSSPGPDPMAEHRLPACDIPSGDVAFSAPDGLVSPNGIVWVWDWETDDLKAYRIPCWDLRSLEDLDESIGEVEELP